MIEAAFADTTSHDVAPDGSDRPALDAALIQTLVDAFYADVRRDRDLGPIFERVIGSHWDSHLQRMYSFWNTVALHAKTFRGNVLSKHMVLPDLREDLFGRWLTIWQHHTSRLLRADDAEILQQTAMGIARNMFLAAFGRVPAFSARVGDEGLVHIETA